MSTKLITAPSAEPATLAEVKLRLRIDGTEFDDILPGLITTARQQAEHRSGRRYGVQTWEMVLDAFPCPPILLPDPPVLSIVSIKYDDPNGTEQTLDPAAYLARLSTEPARLVPVGAWPATFPQAGAVRIRYTCGVVDTDARWDSLKTWIIAAVGAQLKYVEGAVDREVYELPHYFFDGLLDPLRYYGAVIL